MVTPPGEIEGESSMTGRNFPVSEYLRPHILDAQTVSRAGNWWTAVLCIQDPHTSRPYVALYKWQRRNGEWKKASSFKINSHRHLATILQCLSEFDPMMATNKD